VVQRGVEIAFNETRRDTEKADAERFQSLLTGAIRRSLCAMDSAIDFNGKLRLTAVEVEDERSDRLLSAKLVIEESTVAQRPPDCALRLRRRFPVVTRLL
jgi:hypothetical protein